MWNILLCYFEYKIHFYMYMTHYVNAFVKKFYCNFVLFITTKFSRDEPASQLRRFTHKRVDQFLDALAHKTQFLI